MNSCNYCGTLTNPQRELKMKDGTVFCDLTCYDIYQYEKSKKTKVKVSENDNSDTTPSDEWATELSDYIESISDVYELVIDGTNTILDVVGDIELSEYEVVENSNVTNTATTTELDGYSAKALKIVKGYYTRMIDRRNYWNNKKDIVSSNMPYHVLENIGSRITTNITDLKSRQRVAQSNINTVCSHLRTSDKILNKKDRAKIYAMVNFCTFFYDIATQEFGHIKSIVGTIRQQVKNIFPNETPIITDDTLSIIDKDNELTRHNVPVWREHQVAKAVEVLESPYREVAQCLLDMRVDDP